MARAHALRRDPRINAAGSAEWPIGMIRLAAIQLEPVIGEVAENLRRCRALGDEAGKAGADWIVLPEFFTTGMAFNHALADGALTPEGAGTQLLRELARRHGAIACGSFICRDEDGDNRNAWFAIGSDGRVLGRHDKDMPTMWENCFYVGGSDDGVLDVDGMPVGAAMCWELMRTATVRRLRGRVDLVLAGSAWWSVPLLAPARLSARLEAANARTAASVAPAMARAVGAPVAHAAHCGQIRCGLPLAPGVPYRGHYQGGACIVDARGGVLAWRAAAEGPGIVVADVTVEPTIPTLESGPGFWLHPRGTVPAAAWAYQKVHGRRWYRRHALGRAAEHRSLEELTGAAAQRHGLDHSRPPAPASGVIEREQVRETRTVR
jgi:predicted amidohydrolase